MRDYHCLDDAEGFSCEGEAVHRPAMSSTGVEFVRCDKHFAERQDIQRGIVSRYGGKMYYDGPEEDSYGDEDY